MKKKRRIVAILCLTLCLSFVFSPSVYGAPATKQILIEYINDADMSGVLNPVYQQLYQSSSGSVKLRLNDLSGALIANVEELDGLSGTALALDYKLNADRKQLEVDYNLNLWREEHQGSVYFNDGEIILDRECMKDIMRLGYLGPDMINILNLIMQTGENTQYFYIPLDGSDEQMVADRMLALEPKETPAELKEFLVFLVEAVPDKYFSYSLKNQSVVFTLDSAGLANVINSLLEKAANEPDRLADILTGFLTNCLPESYQEMLGADLEEMREDILYSLLELNEFGVPSAAEIQRDMEEFFILDELRLEKSIISKNSSFNLTGHFPADSGLSGDVRIECKTTGSKDRYNGAAICDINLAADAFGSGSISYKQIYQGGVNKINGDYSLSVTVHGDEMDEMTDGLEAKFEISGDYDYSSISAVARDIFKAAVRFDGFKQLSLSLNSDVSAKYEPDIMIEIPELTKDNSANLKNMLNGDPLLVYVDGKPVTTYNWYMETTVPLRELAELLGCSVEWIEPDEIVITRDDITLVMHLETYECTVNGEERLLYDTAGNETRFAGVPPYIYEDKTVISFPALMEAFGCQATYRSHDNSVHIRAR